MAIVAAFSRVAVAGPTSTEATANSEVASSSTIGETTSSTSTATYVVGQTSVAWPMVGVEGFRGLFTKTWMIEEERGILRVVAAVV